MYNNNNNNFYNNINNNLLIIIMIIIIGYTGKDQYVTITENCWIISESA